MKRGFTIGADPELFIVDTSTGNVVTAIGKIPGSKKRPWRGNGMPKGFGLQVDNIAAEFNVPVARSAREFADNMEYMKEFIRSFVKNIDPVLDIACMASASVPPSELEDDEAWAIGCDPDYNAYTEEENPGRDFNGSNMRVTGCHIHVGYPRNNIDTSLKFVKYLDAFVGIPSVLVDDDDYRRTLYGKAGSFRLKPYGVEYRVLSSRMIRDRETTVKLWGWIDHALIAAEYNASIPDPEDVRRCIDTVDADLARTLIRKYGLM